MKTLKDLYNLLCVTGFPVAHSFFLEPQQPPFVVYVDDSYKSIDANSKTLYTRLHIRAELYIENDDITSELTFEQVLKDLSYSKSKMWIDEEKIYNVTYEFDF